VQLPNPPLSPGFVPPPFNVFEFFCLYLVLVELVLLALPRKWGKRVLEVLFPILRRML
jgi:hypothetical protein